MKLLSIFVGGAFGGYLAYIGHPVPTKEYWIACGLFILYGFLNEIGTSK